MKTNWKIFGGNDIHLIEIRLGFDGNRKFWKKHSSPSKQKRKRNGFVWKAWNRLSFKIKKLHSRSKRVTHTRPLGTPFRDGPKIKCEIYSRCSACSRQSKKPIKATQIKFSENVQKRNHKTWEKFISDRDMLCARNWDWVCQLQQIDPKQLFWRHALDDQPRFLRNGGFTGGLSEQSSSN